MTENVTSFLCPGCSRRGSGWKRRCHSCAGGAGAAGAWVKIGALGFCKLLESTFCFLLVVEVFSLQKVAEMLEGSSSQLARSQMNMVDEAKLCNPAGSTFEALIVQHTFGRCCGGQFSPSVDQYLLQALQFSPWFEFVS